METTIMPEITEIIDIISKIKDIELISAEWKERIEKVYPNLNAFAKAEVEVNEELKGEVFLALEFNADKTQYTSISCVKYLGHIGKKDLFLQTPLAELKKPIAIGTNIAIRKASTEEQNTFDSTHQNIGTEATLKGIIIINEVRYFFGFYKTVTPIYAYFPLFESVETYMLSTENLSEIMTGRWSVPMYLSPTSDLYKKAVELYPTMPGDYFTPLSYREQIVNGTNYRILGLFTYAGIGIHHSLRVLHFHESHTGEISNVDVTNYCK